MSIAPSNPSSSKILTVQATSDIESLLEDRSTWNGLSRGVPFRQTHWIGPWWKHLGRQHQASVWVARDGDSIVGILPMYRDNSSGNLRGMADGDACSDYVSVLCREEDQWNAGYAIGRAMAQAASDPNHGWGEILLDGIVDGDLSIAGWMRGLGEEGAMTHAHSRMQVWRKTRDESWAAHLKHHGKTQRRRMRRWSEKFETLDGAKKGIASNIDQVHEYLDAIIRLHQKRWTSEGEAGSFADKRFRQFITETALEFFHDGRLHLSVMKFHGEIIAGEFNLIGNDRVLYSYSAGYDIDHADLEPGRIMCIDSLREMYGTDYDLVAVDFMRGDEAYKARFAKESRPLYCVRVSAPRWTSRMKHAAFRARFAAKQWARKATGRQTLLVADAIANR